MCCIHPLVEGVGTGRDGRGDGVQVRLLREMRPHEMRDVEINTVDGFQVRPAAALRGLAMGLGVGFGVLPAGQYTAQEVQIHHRTVCGYRHPGAHSWDRSR
jgi:hypothetical protein